MKSTWNSEQAVITKTAERQKTSFLKEQVENTDLYKPVFNKIMATQGQCVKNQFRSSFKSFMQLLCKITSELVMLPRL